MTPEIKKSMAELIAAYNRRSSPSASTSNRSTPLRTTTEPYIGENGGGEALRGERGGTTRQNATPTERTVPNISDAENASRNPHLDFSKLFPTGGKSPLNPEATTAISNHIGSNARQLMIMPGHSIIVYLRDGTDALGFNSNTGFAGEFRADVVQKVEPQPEVPLKVAIATRDGPADIVTHHRHVRRRGSVMDSSDDGREFTRFEPDPPELGPAYPQLYYKAQDYIIIFFFKKDVSGYGLNLRTGEIGQFMARDMQCIPPTDPKPVRNEPKRTLREAAGGSRDRIESLNCPIAFSMARGSDPRRPEYTPAELGHSRLPLHPKSVGRREKRPGVDLASEHERESCSVRRAV
jgi:hypothetical protein